MSRARGVCALVLIDDGAATTRDADVPEEIILQRLRASSEDDDGASDDDGDDSVSEEALLRDWRGEDDASVSASSHSQGFSESESGEGSGGSESESGEPGVVDFD